MSSGSVVTSSTAVLGSFMVFNSSIDDSGEVAAVAGFPLVVLLDQDRASKPQERGGVGKDSDDVGAAFDLFIDPFQQVRGTDLSPVSLRKNGEGEEVGPRGDRPQQHRRRQRWLGRRCGG